MTALLIPAQADDMTGEQILSLIMAIVGELRERGILITHRGNEWCVNIQEGIGAPAYVTDDLLDAIEHGRIVALTRAATSKM